MRQLSKHVLDPERLAQAVRVWIRADWYAKHQHMLGWSHRTCAVEIVAAEDELREALTGFPGLADSAKALDCKMEAELPTGQVEPFLEAKQPGRKRSFFEEPKRRKRSMLS